MLEVDAAECAEFAECPEFAEFAELAEALEVAEVREPVPLHAESALAGRGALGASYQSPSGRGQSYVPRVTGRGARGTS